MKLYIVLFPKLGDRLAQEELDWFHTKAMNAGIKIRRVHRVEATFHPLFERKVKNIGYETATQIAREAITTGKSVRELCKQYGILSEEDLDLILDPYEMTNPGISGAPLLNK